MDNENTFTPGDVLAPAPGETPTSDMACVCGQKLPWHLFKLDIGLKHICSCGRTYTQPSDGGPVTFAGLEYNPITQRGNPRWRDNLTNEKE